MKKVQKMNFTLSERKIQKVTWKFHFIKWISMIILVQKDESFHIEWSLHLQIFSSVSNTNSSQLWGFWNFHSQLYFYIQIQFQKLEKNLEFQFQKFVVKQEWDLAMNHGCDAIDRIFMETFLMGGWFALLRPYAAWLWINQTPI